MEELQRHRLPGLEEEVVSDVGLRVQKGLQAALSVYELTLPQSQAPLLDVHDHRIRQMALHHKQRAENHLEKLAEAEVRQSTQKMWKTLMTMHHRALMLLEFSLFGRAEMSKPGKSALGMQLHLHETQMYHF